MKKANNRHILDAQTGNFGQSIAEDFLVNRGYLFVARNIRIGNYGEIDLIFKSNPKKILFVEVKSSFIPSGSMEPIFSIGDRITYRKKLKIFGLARRYCLRNNIDFEENAQIYIAYILLFSIGQKICFKPQFFKLSL